MRRLITILLLAASALPAQAQQSFCQRLAAPTGMTAAPAKPGQAPRVWSTRVLNVAQRFLVGGQAMVSMQMRPVSAPATVQEYERYNNACKSVGKTLGCDLDGPAEFLLNLNGKEARVPVQAGEKAHVEMKGTKISCVDS